MKGDKTMICPNCGRELADGEVCTCTVQNAEPAPVTNEENTTPIEETAPLNDEAAAPEQPAYDGAQTDAPEQPTYQEAQQQTQQTQQNGYYNPYDNAAYYQPNNQQYYAQQAPYYVPTTQAPTASTDYPEGYKPKKKYVAVILAATLGAFGIHNFYLGNNGKAVAQLLLTLLGSLVFGLGLIACEIWVLVEAVQILEDKLDADANGYKIMTLAEEIAREQKKD